ncbi:GNAT family N-acetyltransferase [Pseudoalteromonas sp. A757]|uniref:GNAT family N-acetyltransferase n=1 Tax=Pseudoalteromonas sp. A757 TaxID=2250709 RepID=UPI000FFE8FF9|nr:GNAT family N-acetyltransferase [Pseudoalteromonas sp. A757]RXE89524.1 N-acetyltransferase [Pseudoalteromonas sp. A757]
MSISFETSRLVIAEVEDDLSSSARTSLLEQIPKILTPSVVQSLPPYFHDINSIQAAEIWIERMLSDSRLLQVRSETQELIGFLFVYVENEREAHIGYLIAEKYWGKGLATELLKGFIEAALLSESWVKLIGGVDSSNTASSNLLKKLGFEEQIGSDSNVLFFEYTLHRPPP